jgi:hypothetical protein
MRRSFGATAYRTALLVSASLVFAVPIAFVETYVVAEPHAELWSEEQIWATIVPYGALFLYAVAAFSVVYFGWGRNRSVAMKLALEKKDLEIKLRDLGQQLVLAIQGKPVSGVLAPSPSLIPEHHGHDSSYNTSTAAGAAMASDDPPDQHRNHNPEPPDGGALAARKSKRTSKSLGRIRHRPDRAPDLTAPATTAQ